MSSPPSTAIETSARLTQGESRESSAPESADELYTDTFIDEISKQYDLSAFSGALKITLINAGELFLRYSHRNANSTHDLAPKCRNVVRTAEIAKNLDRELGELDFWDKWQIFKRLEQTGHPVTDNLDTHTRTNPLISGDIVIEEIQLILKAIMRYENEFFEALDHKNNDQMDMGLYFFIKVVTAYWESTTGENLTNSKKASSKAIDFLCDCIVPMATIGRDEIEAVIQQF